MAINKLLEVNKDRKDEFNRFVVDQPTGSFLQSWEWGEWQEEMGRKAYRFFLTDEGTGDVIASIQVFKMPSPFGRYYLYAPYGPVLDKNQESRPKNQILYALTAELKQKFTGAVFLRIEPKFGILDFGSWNLSFRKTVNIQPGKTLVLDLSKSADELLAAMHHKTRYNIKLAQRHKVEVVSDLVVIPGHGLYWQEALGLIVGTAKRQGYKTFPQEYYQKLLDFFAIKNRDSEIKVFVYRALYGRQLLASAVMVDFSGTRTYLFGGSSEKNKNVMAPYLLHFRAMLDAKASGLKCYDFWGAETAGGETPGFVRFKQGFGGRIVEYAGAFDCVFNQGQYKIYRILRFLNRLRYFFK